jgi:acyl carrier protein
MSDIQDKVIEVIARSTEANPQTIKMSSSFSTDLGLDSLDLVDLITELEKKFKVEISDSDAEKILTVQDAVHYIEAKIEEEAKKN